MKETKEESISDTIKILADDFQKLSPEKQQQAKIEPQEKNSSIEDRLQEVKGQSIEQPIHKWQHFKAKTKEDTVISQAVYYELGDENFKELTDLLPPGFEILMSTDQVKDTKGHSYKCLVLIDHEKKEIVFANAGTRAGLNKTGFDDVRDDLNLVMHNKPFKMQEAALLNDMVLDSLGEEAKNYNFHYTGHSLGAAIAEMQAADMDIKLRQKHLKINDQQISAVTFENPGTKPLMEKMYEDAGMGRELVGELSLYEFNNRKNVINSLNDQAGKAFTIIPNDQPERSPNLIQKMFQVIGTYLSRVSWLGDKICSLLSEGGIGVELVQDHTLTNFDQVFVQGAGTVKDKDGKITTMQEAYTGLKSVEYSQEAADALSKLKAENGNVGKQTNCMQQQLPDGSIKQVMFSDIEAKSIDQSLKKSAMLEQKDSKQTSFKEKLLESRNVRPDIEQTKSKNTLPTISDIAVSQTKGRTS